jgi:hypothetical protein
MCSRFGILDLLNNNYVSYQVSVHLPKQFQRRFLEINQPETRIAYGSQLCKQIGMKLANFIEDLP